MIAGLILLGAVAGGLAGLVGVGGGVLITPALVFFFGYTQQMAQGTTLALLLPPIGAVAAYTYYKQGFVDFKAAGWICLGFLVGSLIGSKFAVGLPASTLKKCFGFFLLVMGSKLAFF